MKNLILQLREIRAEHPDLVILGMLIFFGSTLTFGLIQDWSDPTLWIKAVLVQFLAAFVWMGVCSKFRHTEYKNRLQELKMQIKEDSCTLSELNAWKLERRKFNDTTTALSDEIANLREEKAEATRDLAQKKIELAQIARDLKSCDAAMRFLENEERKRQQEMRRKAEEKRIAEQNALLARIKKNFPPASDNS